MEDIVPECRVKCFQCFHQFTVDLVLKDLVFYQTEIMERSLGPEIKYEALVDIECPACGHRGSLVVNLWEYPPGVVNYMEVHVGAGEFGTICHNLNKLYGIRTDSFLKRKNN